MPGYDRTAPCSRLCQLDGDIAPATTETVEGFVWLFSCGQEQMPNKIRNSQFESSVLRGCLSEHEAMQPATSYRVRSD
jgi:hypothetical protein